MKRRSGCSSISPRIWLSRRISAAQPKVLAELDGRLTAYLQAVKAGMPQPNPNYDPNGARSGDLHGGKGGGQGGGGKKGMGKGKGPQPQPNNS